MSTLRTALILAVVQALMPTASGAADLESVLPADTGFVIAIPDVPAFRAHWNGGLPGGVLADPALADFTDALEESLSLGGVGGAFRDATGLEPGDLLARITGGAALAVPMLAVNEPMTEMSYALLLEIPEASMVESLVAGELATRRAKAPEAGPLSVHTETAGAVTLHLVIREDEGGETDLGGWAAVNGTIIRATPSAYLRRLVERAAGADSEPGLESVAAFRAVRERSPDADQYAYANLAWIVPGLEVMLGKVFEGMDQNPNAAAMGVTGPAILEALALEVLQSAWFWVRFGETETTAETGWTYSEERGLMGLLALAAEPCPRPEFIAADVLGMSVTSFSVQRFWNGLLELVDGVSPGAGVLVRTQVQQLGMSAGIDFERDILAQFGESTFSLYAPADPETVPTLGMNQVTGIETRDPAALSQNLAVLIGGFGSGAEVFETREGPGGTVHLMPPTGPESTDRFGYAVTDRYLLFGSGPEGLLPETLAAMQKPGPSLWKRPDLRRAFEAIPAEASGILYYDLPRVFEAVQPTLARAEKDLPDLSAIPRHLGPVIGASVKSEGMLVTSYRLFHPRP